MIHYIVTVSDLNQDRSYLPLPPQKKKKKKKKHLKFLLRHGVTETLQVKQRHRYLDMYLKISLVICTAKITKKIMTFKMERCVNNMLIMV